MEFFFPFKLDISVNIIIMVVLLISGISIITMNYYRKNKFYKVYLNSLKKLSKKYLILETIPEPNTYEEKIIVESLYEINKSMIENINEYQRNINEIDSLLLLNNYMLEKKIHVNSIIFNSITI